MSRNNHVWIGNFSTEKEFERYIDQSAYLQAWDKYNNEPLQDGEEDIEPSDELRCSFCKEIGLDWYDEDFIVIQFNEKSQDIKQLISIIPADTDKLLKACKHSQLEKGNALIYYFNEDLKKSNASKCKSMTYLGFFEETTPTVVGGESLQGLNNHLWAGVTQKTKEEFMEYFNQDIPQCQFCKDVGIKNYNPDKLYVYYGKMDLVETIVENIVPDKELYHIMLKELGEQNLKEINALFCYIDNGFRDTKKDQTFLIYKKEFAQYKIKKTKHFIDEKDDYNDLKYIGNFSWD